MIMKTEAQVEVPLLGITPRFVWLKQRVHEIDDAIYRFMKTQKEIPIEWIDERNIIIKMISKDNEQK